MKKLFLLIISTLLLLTGCSAKEKEEERTSMLPSLEPIVVKLTIEPEEIAGALVTITANVTQAEEYVEDASEVVFELWKDGDTEHEMIQIEHKSEGNYVLERVFDQDGRYTVISHVTARNMHSMPKKEFIVGDVELSTSEEDDHDDALHHDAHDHSSLTVELSTANAVDGIKANTETTIIVHISESDHTPFLDATVQLELWQDGDEKHQYVNAIEVDGSYQATVTFSTVGTYNVQVHIRKGDLHDHVTKTLEVK